MALIETFAPKDDESGFGYYRRLSASNALWNWRELAGLANVSRHPTGLLGQPKHVAAELGLQEQWSQAASLQDEKSRNWRGMHRARNDAVCPACLTDEVYLRGYWEHVYVTACAVHRVRLLDRCPSCGEVLSPNRERIEQCGCGCDLRGAETTPASTFQVWLSTLIASDGLSTGGIAPKLKHVEMPKVCDLVRVLCLHHDPSAPPPHRNAANPKSIQAAVEFFEPLEGLLANWPLDFEAHVLQRIKAGDQSARTLNKLLGRWYVDIRKACDAAPMELFLESILRVASQAFDGTLGLDTAKDVATQVSAHMLLKDAAKTMGVSRDKLLKAALAGECRFRTRRFGTRGLTYEIPISEVERIRNARFAWIEQAQACALALVSSTVLQCMVDAKVVVADVNWKDDILKGAMISRTSICELTERINARTVQQRVVPSEVITWSQLTSRRMGDKQAIRSVMQAAATGELLPVTKGHHLGQIGFLRADVVTYFGTPLLESGLSVNQLSKLTGWKWESISHWIDSGLLESHCIVLRGQPCRVISREQLLKFTQSYIPLADIAKAMGSRPSVLAEMLSGLTFVGGKPTSNGSQRGALVSLLSLARAALARAPHGDKSLPFGAT